MRLATDVPLHDTYFVIAHFHYVMVGSMVFAFLGGMYHWFPKMFGKMCNQNWARAAAIMLFIGFNVTFFPQFVMGRTGALGVGRRIQRSFSRITTFPRSARTSWRFRCSRWR